MSNVDKICFDNRNRSKKKIVKKLSDIVLSIIFIISLSPIYVLPLKAQIKINNYNNLKILKTKYPRAFFFRGLAEKTNLLYKKWSKKADNLGGILAKTLNEEIYGSTKSISYFTRFKKEHSKQIVLLHYNGNSRDPRDSSWKFYPGHWLYYKGTKVLDNIPAKKGFTTINVEDASIFKTNIGRFHNENEDIGLARVDEKGKLDWNHSEQVRLVSVNKKKNTIAVKRGQYHSKPKNFKAGRSAAAPHVFTGPFGSKNKDRTMWMYNHSSACPKDSLGRTADDILVDQFSNMFRKRGKLQWYDGIEFDVLYNKVTHTQFGQKVDINSDSTPDQGIVNGVNIYSIGVFNFLKKLRHALGGKKIILADGMSPVHQRGFAYLNGIESEGWPSLKDPEIKRDWSSGWNRHLFVNENSFKPMFSYINYKYMPWALPVAISHRRLMLAAALLLDASVGIWNNIPDEIIGGRKQQKNWLGKPHGKTVRLALGQPDLLGGAGSRMAANFASKWEGDTVNFKRRNKAMEISSIKDKDMTFNIQGIPADGPDLVVSMKVKAVPRKEYPKKMPRLLKVWRSGNDHKLMTWVNGEWFHATFYFPQITGNFIDLHFRMESNQPLWISNLTVHAYPDVAYREFEHGLALANPAHHAFAFNLDKIDGKKNFKKIQQTRAECKNSRGADPKQLPEFMGASDTNRKINQGAIPPAEMGETVTLGARAGLFLEIENE